MQIFLTTFAPLAPLIFQKNHQDDPTAASKWAIACSAVTFALTLLVVGFHLLPVTSTMVVGTKVEGGLIFILTAFWAANVAIVTNASNGLGVTSDTSASNQVLNGNLYYFSWAGFVTAIVLLVNYFKHAFGVDMAGQIHNRAARLSFWAGLLASALVVMGSSVRVFNAECAGSSANGEDYCMRTKFAISVGAVGVAFAIVVVAMKFFTTSAPFVVEFALAIVLCVLNAFGVAYITSPSGPGSPIGNLYYFSWISFLLSALLMADCFNQRNGGDASSSSDDNIQQNKPEDPTEVEVSNFDENI